MTNFPRRVLPGRQEKYTSAAVWDGPESLRAVCQLRGKGQISLVQPKGADGRPKQDSHADCLRIHRPDKTCVAHPGDLVVTDLKGWLDIVHGYEWAVAHRAYFTQEEN